VPFFSDNSLFINKLTERRFLATTHVYHIRRMIERATPGAFSSCWFGSVFVLAKV
jgi:hypothetical protein